MYIYVHGTNYAIHIHVLLQRIINLIEQHSNQYCDIEVTLR